MAQILIRDEELDRLGDIFVRDGIRRATQMTFEQFLNNTAKAEAYAAAVKRKEQQIKESAI